MNPKLFNLSEEQQNMLSGKKTITADDVRTVFQSYSSGKIKRTKVGRLSVNEFISPEIDFSIAKHEGRFVFFALEKTKESLFSKAQYRVFIWPLGFNVVIAVPYGSVSFEKPIKGYSNEVIFLRTHGNKHEVCMHHCYDRDHSLIHENTHLYREFAIENKKATCIKDYAIYRYRWTNPDLWVQEQFSLKRCYEPWFFSKNDPEKIPYNSVQLSYPTKPALCEHEIHED